MAKFRMKFFGSVQGNSGNSYSFDRGEIIEADKGEFDTLYAEDVTSDYDTEEVVMVPKKRDRGRPRINKQETESASIDVKGEG